jgi:hypothetical protein
MRLTRHRQQSADAEMLLELAGVNERNRLHEDQQAALAWQEQDRR